MDSPLLVVLNLKPGIWLTPQDQTYLNTWDQACLIVFAFLFVLNHKGCLLYHLGLEREVTDWHRASESDTCELHGFALKCTFCLLNARSLSTQFQFQFLDNFDPFSSFVLHLRWPRPFNWARVRGTLGGTTVKAEVEFWHNFAFIVWHNSARKASPIDACSLWQFSMFYKSAEDWWRIQIFVQWNSIMEPEISTIIFSLCTWPKPINTGGHLRFKILATVGKACCKGTLPISR